MVYLRESGLSVPIIAPDLRRFAYARRSLMPQLPIIEIVVLTCPWSR